MNAGKRMGIGAVLTALIVGCGGGGSSSSGNVEGLDVPSQVSLVDAQNSGSLRVSPGVRNVSYDDDPVQFWIHDEAMGPLDTVNMILCSIQQTKYDDPSVLNKGPYIALVSCEERGSGGSDGGRGGSATQYDRFVVDSTRANADSPHIVKFWLDNDGPDDKPGIIYGKVTITESPSTRNPFGLFTMDFKQLLNTQSHDDANVQFRGSLNTVARDDGQAEFEFLMIDGDPDQPQSVGEFAMRESARMVGAADGTSGRAISATKEAFNFGSGPQSNQSNFYVQFNSSYMARKKVTGSSATKVFSRTNFTTNVYRYGVYDATTNQRVESLSGFGVETENGEHGWAGYHGLWFPDHITVTDGQTLIRRSFDPDGTDTNYTAVIVPGRLEKHSRELSTLGNIKNEDLEMFSQSTGSEARVRWNGTDLVQVATRGQDGNWTPQNPASISGSYTAGDWVHFWSRDRGSIEMVWPAAALSDATEVMMWTHETITGQSTELANGDFTLYGYRDRLRPLITESQATWQANETPFFADANNVGEVLSYVFGKTTQMLTQGGSQVRLADGVSVSGGAGQFGFESGPMYATALTSLAEQGQQTTTYRWRTGSNSWNQLRAVRDANGNIVNFTPPLRLSYTHNEPSNTNFHNKTFNLEWTGTDLHGIPFFENTTDRRWRPAFNIPSGTVITMGDKSYKIKQLEGEQEMNEEANPTQVIADQGFDLDVILTAPTDKWTDPAIGAMPDIDDAPKFVGGVAQSDDE